MKKNFLKYIKTMVHSVFGSELKIMTTFNGIGAFSHALKQLDIEIGEQVCCEIDEKANKTYKANNKFKLVEFVNDIRDLLIKIPVGEKFDILVQSAPCQSWSHQGARNGFKSLDGNLFLTAIELQKKVDASVVIYENVKGLLSHEKYIYTYEDENGEVFETRELFSKKEKEEKKLKQIKKVESSFRSLLNNNYKGKVGFSFHSIELELLEDIRYNYYFSDINAANQGFPQARDRVFIIGIKKELDNGFMFPPNIELQFTVEDILESNVDSSYYYTNPNNYTLKKIDQKRRKNKIHTFARYEGLKFSADARVLYPYVAPTITTNNNNKFLIDGKIRKLTQTENKRIFGFSEDFKLVGSKTIQNKQLGNSVVPAVYKSLLVQLFSSLQPNMFVNEQSINNTNYNNKKAS